MINKRGELYRNSEKGKLAGVCAGIADYFGWETWLVRILVVSGVLFGMPFLIFGYFAAWFILDVNPKQFTKHSNSKRHQSSTSNEFRHKACNTANKTDDENDNESIKVKARVWQSGEPPKQAFHDIRKKFLLLEKKLQGIEQYVTSPEFTVTREINKL